MGVRASETGVTLKFFTADGTMDTTKPPVTGEYAYFFSIPRPENPSSTDPLDGSQDWLTDIIVLDNPAKLKYMTPTQTGIQLTSAASKRVLVRWDVGAQSGTQGPCITISSGHWASGHLFAELVKVLPDDVKTNNMNDKNHLWPDWLIGVKQFLAQAASPEPTSSSQTPSPGTGPSNKP
jgi:hypothetical protein